MIPSVHRGDVVYVDLGYQQHGSEQAAKRPAIVVQNEVGNLHSTTTLIVPLTSKYTEKARLPTHVSVLEVVGKPSLAMTEQARVVDKTRIVPPGVVGRISEALMAEIERALLIAFWIDPRKHAAWFDDYERQLAAKSTR